MARCVTPCIGIHKLSQTVRLSLEVRAHSSPWKTRGFGISTLSYLLVLKQVRSIATNLYVQIVGHTCRLLRCLAYVVRMMGSLRVWDNHLVAGRSFARGLMVGGTVRLSGKAERNDNSRGGKVLCTGNLPQKIDKIVPRRKGLHGHC